jgi:GcrA cell cycle regulator
MWNEANVKRLRELFSEGLSAAQIATQLDCSRSAVCAKLGRLKLKRGRKPPTAKPKIVTVPNRPAADRPQRQPPRRVQYTKGQLRAILAEAVRNTGH